MRHLSRDEHLQHARRQHPEESAAEHEARADYRAKHLRRRHYHTQAVRVVKRVEKLLPWAIALLLIFLLFRPLGHAQTTNGNMNLDRVAGTKVVFATGVPMFCVSGCSASTNPSFGAAFPATGVAIGAKFGANMVNLGADASNNLFVNCAVGCGASGFTDNGAFTTGTSQINNIGGLYDDTPPTAVVTGHAAAVRITLNRALHINLRNQAGAELGTAGAPVRTDPTGSTTQPISAAALPLPSGASTDSSLTNGNLRGTITQGATGSLPASWWVQVSDGTTGPVAVKAASTAAAAADKAIVVSISPNSPLPAGSAAIGSVSVSNFPATQPVSGTVAVSNFPATQPVSGTTTANQGTANTAANGWPAKITDGTNTAAVKAASTAPAAADPALVVGFSPNSQDRIVGNAGAAFDAANNAAPPANVVADGFEAQSSALGTAATAGNMRRGIVGLDGVLYVRMGSPLLWSCGLTAIAATLTQCQAAPAAGTSLFITDITILSDTATAGSYLLRQGTGSNCGTGTATIFPAVASLTAGKLPYPANTATGAMFAQVNFQTPLKLTAANALCVICVATNTCTVSAQGFTAP